MSKDDVQEALDDFKKAIENYKFGEYSSYDKWVAKHSDTIRQALQSQKAVDDGWLPIESAPKKTYVMIYQKGYLPQKAIKSQYLIKLWRKNYYWFSVANVRSGLKPTHWQPLPQPPQKE